MVFDAQATPAMANKVIERVRKVTDKPIKYVVLSHYHAVRVLGASAYQAQAIVASEETVGWSTSAASRTGIPNTAAFRACSRMPRAFPA